MKDGMASKGKKCVIEGRCTSWGMKSDNGTERSTGVFLVSLGIPDDLDTPSLTHYTKLAAALLEGDNYVDTIWTIS
jgi:hypothetical protein